MSCENTNARIQIKYSTVGGQVPSIPSTNDHNDGTWNPTDIYIGEFFLNSYDDLLWVRTLGGILPIGVTGGSASIIGDFVSKANGGTYSGPIFAPTMSTPNLVATTISATAIDATIFGSTPSLYYGDGSNLTGITTVWNGGTVSLTSVFNDYVEFQNGLSVGNISNLGNIIYVNDDTEFSGGVSASYFIGDGSLITNLPLGPTANDYTTAAYLDGNIIRYDRTDLADAYSVDLTPILITQSISNFNWDSATNDATISINDGSFFTINLGIFNDISTAVINATDVYANNFYGTFNGTQSGPSINAIISTTYEDLIISASNSTLLPGNWYNFSYSITGVDPAAITVDYNIFLFALTTGVLDLTAGKRVMDTPIFDNGVVEDWYNTAMYNIGDKVIFCNRVWNNIAGGAGSIDSVYNLDAVTWELEISPLYYKSIAYDISYNLINKEVTHQRDSYGNEIYGEGQIVSDLYFPQNTIDISDWNYNNYNKFDNYSFGMWNNVNLDSFEPTIVYNNNVQGLVYGNVCTKIYNNVIHQTTNSNIKNNVLSISNNSIYNNRVGAIQNNTNTLSISYNSNSGFINDNTIDGVIYNNDNAGDIENNIGGAISGNKNNGDIKDNSSTYGTIINNSNLGDIDNNTSATDGSIYNNSNGSNISYNVVQTTISFNSNVGFISNNTISGSIFSNNGTGNIDSNTIGDSIEYNNTGSIENNTCGLISYNTGGLISLNSNDGSILYNTISNTIVSNDNSGTISWNVSDTIANNTSDVVDIDENKVGFIESNENVGVITNNVARKIIDNTNDGDIRFNNMTGNIENNDNTGVINYNSGFDIENNGFQVLDIELNEVTDRITNNTNVGYISQNQAGEIYNNSNNCNIYSNDVEQSISNNTNNGDIYKNKAISINSNNLSGGTIDSNVVKGDIYGNSGAGTMNLNVCAGISNNSKSAISRNTIGGVIENNNVTSIVGNTGCNEGIISNTLSGTILNNDVGYQISSNTNTGDISRNNVSFKISINLPTTGDILRNICYTIENN